MTIDEMIKQLEEIKKQSTIPGNQLVYFGDKKQSADYFVISNIGELIIKEEWY